MSDRGAGWRRRPGEPPRIYGHRGVRGDRPENTMLAFEHAASEGADGIELVLWPDDPIAYSIYGVTDPADWEWMRPRLHPHPWRAFTDRLRLAHPEAVARLPRTVINCPSTLRMRAGESLERYHIGDRVWELDTGHDLMITEPERTAEMLLKLAEL